MTAQDRNNIITKINNYFQIGDLRLANRQREKVDARAMCYHYLNVVCNITLTDIGKMFGNRDHSTVIHGLRTFDMLYTTDKRFRADYRSFVEAIGDIEDNIDKVVDIEKCTTKIEVLVTTDEYKLITRLAERDKLPRSHFARKIVRWEMLA
jgi:hypothetical protein